jgi:polysaccharide deacetylase family protein (PEP-CTERM system associated)
MSDKAAYVLSVDVEDYFQVEAFARQVSRDEWNDWPSRVVDNTRRALNVCDAHGASATFFVLGWVAHKFPALVREIQSRGHEIACHSFWHRPVCSLTPETFREDLRQACDAIAQACGERPIGFRAPSWSITPQSTWAFEVLAQEGFVYDASIFPIRHDLYGYAGGNRFPHSISTSAGELLEFPSATVQLLGTNVPTGGGGYLRILPFAFTDWALKRLGREDGRAVVVYFHPWELDPDQPRIEAPWKSRFRHYTNLSKMEPRLRRLLSRHSFQPFRELVKTPPAMTLTGRVEQHGQGRSGSDR